jgi:hypothetical protein
MIFREKVPPVSGSGRSNSCWSQYLLTFEWQAEIIFFGWCQWGLDLIEKLQKYLSTVGRREESVQSNCALYDWWGSRIKGKTTGEID